MKPFAHHKFVSLCLAVVLIALAAVPAMAQEVRLDIQFSGVIDVVPANPGDPWQIAGQSIAVNDATQVLLTKEFPAAPSMWATVHARRLADDSLVASRIIVQPPEMHLRGPVQALPEAKLGVWTIAGLAFQVDEATIIGTRTGEIAVGDWVEVIAVEEPGGSLRALRIHRIEGGEDVQVHGAIQAVVPWLISAVPLTTGEDTLIVGEPGIGLLATALATLQPDNTLQAKAIKVHWTEPQRERPRQPEQLRGTIETLPAEGLIGAWTVNGKTVNVTEATRIFQVKGLVAVGAEVQIVGWLENNEITAATITVLQSPDQGGRRFQFRGEIVTLPPGSKLYGQWVIDVNGEQIAVQVHLRTRIEGKENAEVGAQVEVGGVQLRDGTRLTTWLRIQDRTGGGPGPGPTATPPAPGPGPTGTPPGPGPHLQTFDNS